MINILLSICCAIIIYEFFRYINFVGIVKINLKLYNKIFKLFKFKNSSDFRKEKLIFNYSKSLFFISIKIFAILFSLIIFFLILELISDSYLNFITSLNGIIILSSIFIIYHIIRKKINAKL